MAEDICREFLRQCVQFLRIIFQEFQEFYDKTTKWKFDRMDKNWNEPVSPKAIAKRDLIFLFDQWSKNICLILLPKNTHQILIKDLSFSGRFWYRVHNTHALSNDEW